MAADSKTGPRGQRAPAAQPLTHAEIFAEPLTHAELFGEPGASRPGSEYFSTSSTYRRFWDQRKAEQEARRRTLRQLLAILVGARERGAPWYTEALEFAYWFNRRPLVDRQDGWEEAAAEGRHRAEGGF